MRLSELLEELSQLSDADLDQEFSLSTESDSKYHTPLLSPSTGLMQNNNGHHFLY